MLQEVEQLTQCITKEREWILNYFPLNTVPLRSLVSRKTRRIIHGAVKKKVSEEISILKVV